MTPQDISQEIARYVEWVDKVVKAESAGTPHHELVIQVCRTPTLLVQHGCADLPLLLKAKTVGKMFFDHGLTQRQISELPSMLDATKGRCIGLPRKQTASSC